MSTSLLRACPPRALRALARPQSSTAFNAALVTERPARDVAPIPAEKDLVPADAVSGAPAELRQRMVRIYQPTRNTMQSGGSKGNGWRLDWDILPGGGRWENGFIGWGSSADYMQGTRQSFHTKEQAIAFAERQGWDYYVQSTNVKKVPPKNYAENYVYKPTTLRICRTK